MMSLDFTNNLRDDFFSYSLFLSYKKKLKKIFMEVCFMEKEKNDKKGGSYFISSSFFMSVQAELKLDVGEDSSILFMSFDASPFGLGFIIHKVFCQSGKCYRRIMSGSEISKFVLDSVPNSSEVKQ